MKNRTRSRFPCPGRRQVLAALLLVLLGGSGSTRAHLLLYENVEIYLDDPERIRIEFTVHAPELPLAVSRGIDPAAVDEAWLPGLDDESLTILCAEATTFVRRTILLEHPDLGPLSQLRIAFPDPETLRASPENELLPAGCLLGTAWLENRRSDAPLVIGFSPSAEKRLLVSIARPAAFPEVHDLGPGENVNLALPPVALIPDEPTVPEATGRALPTAFLVGGVALLIAIAWSLFLLARRRRRHPA